MDKFREGSEEVVSLSTQPMRTQRRAVALNEEVRSGREVP